MRANDLPGLPRDASQDVDARAAGVRPLLPRRGRGAVRGSLAHPLFLLLFLCLLAPAAFAQTDTDGDGLFDAFEIANGFDPLDPDENINGRVDGQDDFDADGLGNAAEIAAGTNPFLPDTDGDGALDGTEFGTGSFDTQIVISTAGDGPASLVAADLDGDGDPDLLTGSTNDDTIAWFANSAGTFGAQQVISTAADSVRSVFAADVDGDGDLDALSASYNDHEIAWYENGDGLGTFGPEQVVFTTIAPAQVVHAADLDGDHDMDVLSGSVDGTIAWYENVDGRGAFGALRLVADYGRPKSIATADTDGVADGVDNCPGAFNPLQTDTGGGGLTPNTPDGVGNLCQNADFNGDGKVDMLDVTLLRRWVVGLEPALDPALPPSP